MNAEGASLVVAILLLKLGGSLCSVHMWFMNEQVRNRIVIYVQTLVFRQSLRLSSVRGPISGGGAGAKCLCLKFVRRSLRA